MNTKQQGDRGVAAAIAFYTLQGFGVSVPLTDNERYDIIVDKKSDLLRVQCKTTTYKRNEKRAYEVMLRTSGGNQSWSGVSKTISSEECDLLFILSGDGRAYEFEPDIFHGKSSLSLGPTKDSNVVMVFPESSLCSSVE